MSSRKPHFFKVYSRLGLIHAPVHSDQLNIGVEDAPDLILEQFLNFPISQYKFPLPQEENYWQILAKNLKEFKDLINKELRDNETQIVIGGDNSVTFSSLIAIQERMKDPSKLGYIQFDSHGECNKLLSSPTGNFHGMYMRPLLAKDFEVKEINNLVKTKIPIENVLCIGNQDLDGDEPEFFRVNNIKVLNREKCFKKEIKNFLRNYIKQFEHLHVNFDIDVMDRSIAPATGIPNPNGFFPEEIFSLLQIIKTHPDWSLDLVEVNPKKEGSAETVKFAQDVLKFSYGN